MDQRLSALSRDHMVRQVRAEAAIQRAVSSAWGRTLDPLSLDATFPDFVRLTLPLIRAGRSRSTATARTFYAQSKLIAGLTTPAPAIAVPILTTEAATAALRINGPVNVKKQMTRGVPVDVAMTVAQAATLRAAKRLTLDASRATIIGLTKRDTDAEGWARESDGKPCSFCAMLVGRGPVYSEATATFRSHNGCCCSARPVFDRADGWSPQARAIRDLYDEAGASDFRTAYRERMAESTSDLAQALAA
ncbi:hypothetical protein N1031_06900 [Herbiconiux moechotypicola]|uniref:MuF-like minor capsid protein n=1 Tax=Herbiconiux moechotypicola TaxID=637393 RepID=A0ABN3DGP8_9MICO|nr:hypothetical protein [Herbiconiux moechotypicola]MCS5729484.1 hypothetical protein [Herbiconiux moechotypicola]